MSTLRQVQASQQNKGPSKYESANPQNPKVPQFGNPRNRKFSADSDNESPEYIRPRNRRDENDAGKQLGHNTKTAGMSSNNAAKHMMGKAKNKKGNFDDYYKKSFGKFLQKKESGLNEIRRQVEESQMAEVMEKPKLVAKQMPDMHINLMDRMDIIKAKKEREMSRLKREQEERNEREYRELTFQPKINPNSTALWIDMHRRRENDPFEMRRREPDSMEFRYNSRSPVPRQESQKRINGDVRHMPLYERQNITNILGGIVGNIKDSNRESSMENRNLRSPGVEDKMRQFFLKEEEQRYGSGVKRASQDPSRGGMERIVRNESGKGVESVRADQVKNMERNVSQGLQRMTRDVKKELYSMETERLEKLEKAEKPQKKKNKSVKEKVSAPVEAKWNIPESKKPVKVEKTLKFEESMEARERMEPEMRQPPALTVDYGQVDLDKLDFILNQYNRMKKEEEEEQERNNMYELEDEVDEVDEGDAGDVGEEGEEEEEGVEDYEEAQEQEKEQHEEVEEEGSRLRSHAYIDSNVGYNRHEENATVNEFTVNEEVTVCQQDQSPPEVIAGNNEEYDLEAENEEEIDYIKQNLMDIQDNLAMIKHSFKVLQDSQQNLPVDFRFPNSPVPQPKVPAKAEMHRFITFDAERHGTEAQLRSQDASDTQRKPEEAPVKKPELKTSKSLMVEQAKNKLKVDVAKSESEAGSNSKDEGTDALLHKLLENYMQGQSKQVPEEPKPKASSLNNVESKKQTANNKKRSVSPAPAVNSNNNAKNSSNGRLEASKGKAVQNSNAGKAAKNKAEVPNNKDRGLYGSNTNASGKGRSVSPTPMLRTAHMAAKRSLSPMEGANSNPMRGSKVLNMPVSQSNEYPSLFGEGPVEQVNKYTSRNDKNVSRRSLNDDKELMRSSQMLKDSAYKTLIKFHKGKFM